MPLDPALARDIDAVRDHAHVLGARSLAATFPTLDGEVTIDYRPDTWLAITLWGDGPDERVYMFGPDWPEEDPT